MLIPYQTSSLPEGPWLVFAPHPDDETFGMGGSLLLAFKKAVKITLVVLTDGSMGGQKTESDNMVSIREKEAAEVSQRLHLEAVSFWRQPDRGLKVSKNLIARVAELVGELKPASIFFPSPMELHPDHRTAATLVWEGLRACPTFSGKAYAYEISVQCPTNRLVDITAVANEKRALAAIYKSQITERDYLSAMLALNRTRSYTLPPEVLFAEAFFSYERIGETDLSLLTLDSLRPYWSNSFSSREEENDFRENLNEMLISIHNETEKRLQRCKDIENSLIWRYTKSVRAFGSNIRPATSRAHAEFRRWKDYFRSFLGR